MALREPAAALLGPLAAVLNRNLADSTPGRALLDRLSGRSFAVRITGVGLRVRVSAGTEELAFSIDDEPADAEVCGAPFALMALLRSETPVAGSAGVTISGDPEVLQQFKVLLERARPEPEAELARLIGEAPAHLAGRAVAGLLAFAGRIRTTTRASVAEYLTEESRDLAARGETDLQAREVNRLRDDVERAAARIALIESRLQGR